jgi:RHS repeat-associated protein
MPKARPSRSMPTGGLAFGDDNSEWDLLLPHRPLGTLQFLTDPNQIIAWQADYEPFGKAAITTALVTNNLRFPGQYFDEETGLHYNYFRDYDPPLGRYIQSDPIRLESGLNTYGYAFQNPLRFADPTGENPTIPIIIAACLGDPVCALPLIAGASHAITKCIDTVRDLTSSPMFNESTDDKPYAGETPDDKPGDFVPIGEGDKRKLSDGSIWSPDKAGHAGSKWKRWPNERARREGKKLESVRPDGSVR